VSQTEAVVAVIFFSGLFLVLFRLAGAVARRISGDARRGPTPDELTALRVELGDELAQVRQQVGELAERVDFTERLLAKQKDGERLAPPRGA
jgi:NTP pyrophosphatase (non-canonical NTP hydrolase)